MKKVLINDSIVFDEASFTKIDMFKTRDSVAFMLNFLPGQNMKQHGHPGKELYLYVIDGKGQFEIDDEIIEVSVGDVIHCQADEKLGFTNTSNANVSVYVTMNKVQA